MVSLSGFLNFQPYNHMRQESRRTSLGLGLGTFLNLNMAGWEVLSRAFFHLAGYTKVRPGEYGYHRNQEDWKSLIRSKGLFREAR
jgi:hypothetical protein